MNEKDEYTSNKKYSDKITINTFEREIKNMDKEDKSSNSHQIQRPTEISTKLNKNLTLSFLKGNESGINAYSFKTTLKKENKQIKKYKESLDKKIELLRSKINEKNLTERININVRKNKNSSVVVKLTESTLKGKYINNSLNNFNDLLLFSSRGGKQLRKNKHSTYDINNNKYIKYDLFCKTFFDFKNHEKSLNCLLSILNSNDLFKLFSLNKVVKNGIINFLKNKTKVKIINKFISKYCNNILFSNESYDFKLLKKQYKKNTKAHIRIILAIKATISDNNTEIINKKHQIVYQILNPRIIKNSTFTTYSFEILPKKIPKKFWICKEYTSFHYDDHDKAYYNDLVQFWPTNQILINIGLITEYGILDFDNFHWLNPRILPKIQNFKISNISTQSYLTNSENTCEVEGLVNGWNEIKRFKYYNSTKKTLNDLFGENFNIKEVFFEDVGYYLFKIILEAKKIGECKGVNNNIGIKIKIYPKKDIISNEIKKNGLIYDEKNELNIHLDDIITFYMSTNK